MSFYVYRAIERTFLAADERSWTDDFLDAAGFSSRDLADNVAVRELGEGHDAYVLDDGDRRMKQTMLILQKFQAWRSRAIVRPTPTFSRLEHVCYAAISIALAVAVLVLGLLFLDWCVTGIAARWHEVTVNR